MKKSLKESPRLTVRHGARSTLFLGICTLLLMALAACGQPMRLNIERLAVEESTGYESPYNWEGLTQVNGRFTYSEQGEQLSRLGIDVSSHQGSIDWQAVAADGIEFAIIRLGYRGYSEGQLNLDEYYEANYRGATEAGIPVGVYFFSQALTEEEASAEAYFVLEHLEGRALQYPVVYDFEPTYSEAGNGRANDLANNERTSNALIFCQTLEARGYSTMIYGNVKDIAAYYLDVLEGRPIWFAEYDASYPSGSFDFSIWQYSSTGQVAGIDTKVDMDIELVSSVP